MWSRLIVGILGRLLQGITAWAIEQAFASKSIMKTRRHFINLECVSRSPQKEKSMAERKKKTNPTYGFVISAFVMFNMKIQWVGGSETIVCMFHV